MINLQDNFINNENAKEILSDYAMVNIYLDNVTLKGNKSLNPSILENITDECRKNLLI